MKFTYSAVWRTLIIMSAFLFFFSGCKKDENDKPDPGAFRIKTMYSEDGIAVVHFIYNDDNRLSKLSYTENGTEVMKNEWTWVGNSVTIVHLRLQEGNWVNITGDTTILTYSDGKVVKSEIIDNQFNHVTINTYTWNGDLLMNDSSVLTYNSGGNYTRYNQYIYDDGRLTTINRWQSGILSLVQTIEYSNGKPVVINDYVNGNLDDQVKFTYTGDNLTTVTRYEIYGIPQVECVETRSYDAANLVSKITSDCGSEPRQFTYEAGKGNFNDLILSSGGWLNVYLFPNSFPSELIY